MTRERVLVYERFERFWHWMQAGLILFLAVTGFEIHGSLHFLGFEQAVRYHTLASTGLLVLVGLAIFWHFTTGEWRQYVPTTTLLREHCTYYLHGIFRNLPHPSRKTRVSKLNPLQRIVYVQLKLLVVPVMVISGLLYQLYRYPHRLGIEALDVGGLELIAVTHTAGAFFLVAFTVAHVYLTTTGETVTSNLKAMITGYEDVVAPRREEPSCTPGI